MIVNRLLAIFLLGALAFSPPFLAIFAVDDVVFGMPVLFLYLFGAWALLIALVAATLERSPGEE